MLTACSHGQYPSRAAAVPDAAPRSTEPALTAMPRTQRRYGKGPRWKGQAPTHTPPSWGAGMVWHMAPAPLPGCGIGLRGLTRLIFQTLLPVPFPTPAPVGRVSPGARLGVSAPRAIADGL